MCKECLGGMENVHRQPNESLNSDMPFADNHVNEAVAVN